MAFIGLSDRFEQRYKEIYGKYSSRGPDGEGQPFLEFKPDDPHRNDTRYDSQISAAFSASYRRDLTRISRFLKSGPGIMFLLRQTELQTGNTFSETRIINPLFIIGNVPGVTRMRRPLGASSGMAPGGDITNISGGADSQIGSAGRLQKKTKELSIINQMGVKGPSGLLNLLPPNVITRTVSGLKSVFGDGPTGVLDIDDRPEIDFQGQFFSTAIWRGFKSAGTTNNAMDVAGTALSRGDLKGAVSAIRNGVSRVISGVSANVQKSVNTERGNVEPSSLAGYRYFVIDKNSGADRYLSNSISFTSYNSGVAGQTTIRPVASLGTFNRSPAILTGVVPVVYSAKDYEPLSSEEEAKINKTLGEFETKYGMGPNPNSVFTTVESPRPQINPSSIQVAQQTQTQSTGFWRKVGSSVSTISKALFGGSPSLGIPTSLPSLSDRKNALTGEQSSPDPNPGFAKMIYPDLSLQSRYKADQKKSMSIDSAKENWWKSFDVLKKEPTYKNGNTFNFGSGFKAGQEMPFDIATRKIKSNEGRYFHDNADISSKLGIIPSKGTTNPTDGELTDIRKQLQETTDFIFYDFVNKNILPFRAFLTDINESISPNVSEQQYIGRIERNIVYVGVVRELSFSFRVQAFSPSEMRSVWSKVNMLTGLTFPSKYVKGFLVPPFTKLTIGNVFVDQPGYLKSLSYQFDDDGWEIDENYQAPMGITVNAIFSIIEKRQMQTNSVFYPYGDKNRGIKLSENNAGDQFTQTPTSPSNAPPLDVNVGL